MNPKQQRPVPTVTKARKRRGIVLVAVLIVVASLSYAGYQFSDMMVSEFKASENSHGMIQARHNAASGVHYAAALLSNPDNFNGILGGNPFNNPQAFRDIPVPMDGARQGRFSIIAPPDMDAADGGAALQFGVSDESGKINLNAVMKIDPSGQAAFKMLMKLPNMTEDIANSIVAWLGGAYGAQNGGAQNDYYSGQSPSYRLKNGPIDSVHELLLVRGVTRDLLYGNDLNGNGIQDANEATDGNGFSRGWSPYLTVHSREQNRDAAGKPYVLLNDPDLAQLYTTLPDNLSREMANFIILYRQNASKATSGSQGASGNSGSGATKSSGSGSSGSTGSQGDGDADDTNNANNSKNSNNTRTIQGDLASVVVDPTKKASHQINSLFDLVNVSVTIATKDDKGKTVNVVYNSPLNDLTNQRTQLPILFAGATVSQDTDLAARVNVNTAPRAVLSAVGFSDSAVEKIISSRPAVGTDSPDAIFSTPAWLLTEAQISETTLTNLEQYFTTRSQVYRVQSVGYFDGGKGSAVRVEAVVDTNNGRPRIIAWRDLSELGKGLNDMAPAP